MGFSGSVRFDAGLAGRGAVADDDAVAPLGVAGPGRLWAMQDMSGLAPYGGVPFDMGGQFAAEVGYGMAGPGGRGPGTPFAGVTQSGIGGRVVRYGWRWTVAQRFEFSLERSRQRGFGGSPTLDRLGGGLGLDRLGGRANHSV